MGGNATSRVRVQREIYEIFRKKLLPHVIPAAILIIVTLSVYLRSLGHDFQLFWDDEQYVRANEAARGFTLTHLKSAFTRNYLGNYAPVQIISYMLDYSIWGMKAAGFFLTNITLHLVNGILFYSLLNRLGFSRVGAFVSSFVFLLHPVQVESVAWVAERKNLLAMFFSLSAFVSYLSYRERGWDKGKLLYLSSVALFLLALLSKSVAVVFPVILVLHDICFLEKEGRNRLQADKIPYFLAALVMAWVTMMSQMPGDLPGMGGGRTSYHGGSPYATLLTMLTVLVRYLKLVFWPTDLSAVYDPPIRTVIDNVVLMGGLTTLCLTAAGAFLYHRERKIFFWYGLFFVGLLPVCQIVPIVTLMNDRYLYFPMLGAAALIGCLASKVDLVSRGRRIAFYAATGAILTALPYLSFARVGVWRNDLTLWSDAAKKAPNHFPAVYGLAQALQNSGEAAAALPLYERALLLKPRDLDTLTHLGALYRAWNMPLKGRSYLLDVTRHYPKYGKGFVDLGINYYQTDELEAAEGAFRRALALGAADSDVYSYMGMISLKQRNVEAAREHFSKVVSLRGPDADTEYNLACVEALGGRHGESLRHLESAFRLGFRDRESIERDEDISAIRHLPRFNLLVENYLGGNGGNR